MKKLNAMLFAVALGSCMIGMSSCDGKKWTEEQKGSYNLVIQQGGQTLGYSPTSGVTLLTDKGYAFKDLNRNGVLDPYEDWRLDPKTRAIKEELRRSRPASQRQRQVPLQCLFPLLQWPSLY